MENSYNSKLNELEGLCKLASYISSG